jgi:putative nucleotidyltransferase with HDIG domain
MNLKRQNERKDRKTLGHRVDEYHRSPTRTERARAWLEDANKPRLYVGAVIITWISLVALISIETDPLAALGIGRERDEYEVGSVSQTDVYATRNLTYEDSVATEDARREAEDEAAEVYQEDPEVPDEIESDAREFFAGVREVRASDGPADQKVEEVTAMAPFYLPDDTARTLVFLEDEELDDVELFVVENLRDLYASTAVADDDVERIPAAVATVSEARARLSEDASRDASGEVGEAVEVVSRGFVEPDYVIDREATEEARTEAAAQVQPIEASVKQGERIVGRGEVIDREDVARLEALDTTRQPNTWGHFLGTALVVAAEMGIAWYFLERFGRRILRTNALMRIVLAASLAVLFTLLARLFVILNISPYLTPLAGLSLLGTILLGPRLMFLMVVVTSVNVGIIGGNDFFLTAALLLSSGFAIYTVVRVSSRTELLKAGLFIAGITGIVTFAVSLLGGSTLYVALTQGGLGLGNGLLSLMLATAVLPLLENTFNILTPMKLLELSDPGGPLLQKLLRNAPGTFSHSMQVGIIAENAAERIGADALLARVGAYYHDVGKLEHPAYFVENQIGQLNPHATLSAPLSARVIKRHVKDGLEIGRAWNLPEEILDLIAEHHGTTRIEYFYRKAVEEAAEGETVHESEFRYPGPPPRSKEAGILMISDAAEATVKSLAKPTPKRIEDIVAETIRKKQEDGQFDECELTMREINDVREAVVEALIGFLGPRIEYPAGASNKVPNGTLAKGVQTNDAPSKPTSGVATDTSSDPTASAPADAGPEAATNGSPDPVRDRAGKPT